MRKYALALLALLWLAYAALPAPATSAASLYRFEIFSRLGNLIAGEPYYALFQSDRGFMTKMQVYFDYSVNNGGTWTSLPIAFAGYDNYFSFRMPNHPELTSAIFRIGVYFTPLVGSDTYSEKIVGPYRILQPNAPSNVKATANDDGTVTLTWEDNSNMERAYRITRNGPDGTKVFTAGDTTDYVGPVVYTDKTVNTSKDTIYVYTLSMEFDEKHELPAELDPGIVYVPVKTKAPVKPPDLLKFNPVWIGPPNLNPVVISPKLTDYEIIDDQSLIWKDAVVSQNLWEQLERGNKTLPAYPVSGVKIGSRSVSIGEGEVVALLATVQPADATNKRVTWSSDNAAVAAVDAEGRVTGVAPGTAKITVKTEEGGFSDHGVVTVIGNGNEDDEAAELPMMNDLIDHPAQQEIAEALALGVVNGYPDGTFRPDAGITRAEFAAMLMRGLKMEGIAEAPLAFKDRAAIGEWAAGPVAQAVQLGIINGYGDRTFRPQAPITRAEMITMVMRASGQSLDGEAAPMVYTDAAAIPDWARPSVSKAQLTGIIIVGGLDASFEADRLASRAESVSAIVRMLKIRNPA